MSRDLVVVGGGPAGLACAIHAARAGLTVTVLERRRPPIDKACGEGILGDGVAALVRLGLDRLAGEGQQLAGIRWRDLESSVEAEFPSGREGIGMRRTRLHRALVSAAEAAGVELLWGVKARSFEQGAVHSEAGRFAGRWMVGADGLRSAVRVWGGFARRPARCLRFGVRRHYALPPWSEGVEVWWAEGCEAYVTPVGPEEVGLAMLWSGVKSDFDSLLRRFPALDRRLEGAEMCSRDRGAGPLAQPVRSVARGRLALVGDAAGYVDAITGEGLDIALREAEALVAAILDGDLGGYARASRGIRRRPELLTRLLLAIERRPELRRRFLGMLARQPGIFRWLLALHVGGAGESSRSGTALGSVRPGGIAPG